MTQQSYNSHEHLIQIKGKDGQIKDYLPANWRLHELRVTYPTATIESEIVHMNEEKNIVVMKAWIFDGPTYAESSHRASSYKQGLLSALDKVETGAKSRAARDFGIGTEFALEAEPEEDLDTPPVQPTDRPTTRRLPARAQAPQPPQNEQAGDESPATSQQLASLKNLAERLRLAAYQPPQTAQEARGMLADLSRQYNEQQKALAR